MAWSGDGYALLGEGRFVRGGIDRIDPDLSTAVPPYCQPVAVNAPVGALGWSQSVFFM
jgi:hypothetical protein